MPSISKLVLQSAKPSCA
ncbi:uncharacterized protein CPUR_05855 [Claviceps purpurea 20.1]|uniref:Uncharacterized protein n=1 Tax=Claviceps purpurea (strain 20.1) TaxID=1111077 RepID=M1VWW8_CLAP2|nr:uncharacterized protein CPUR_05855 [Claviceps purpurea 20.1]